MFTHSSKNALIEFSKEHWVLSSVLLWSGLVCALSAIYVSIGIFWWSALPPMLLYFTGMFYVAKQHAHFSINKNFSVEFFIITLNIILAFSVWNGRTDSALQSPWTQIPSWFFPLFFLNTLLLLYSLWNKKFSQRSFFAALSHISLFLSIAFLSFRFGYAYDPLIHQAAEKYVSEHGKIEPLQPFYIGQYALVSALHTISQIPTIIIDRALLPLLASVSIPIIGFVGLTKGWKISKEKSLVALCGILIIPLSELTFTVPHNISVLLLIWWILLLPYALTTRGGKITLAALALSATTFHPLIGIPLCIGTIISIALNKYPRRSIAVLGSILIGLGLATMFGIYRIQHGETFFASTVAFDNFLNIFSFTQNLAHVRPRLQLLYGLHFLIPYAIIAAGIALSKKTESRIRWSLFSISGGILFGIFLISTLISIPGIVSYEQNEFALRLKNILPLFFIPFIISRVDEIRYKKIAVFICAILITTSLYFSYPRVDGVAKPGWNISRGDVELTKNIPQIAKNKPYIVLSNQILAAAGLRELGFDKRLIVPNTIDTYPYSIAMSEPIYPLTQKILYQELNGVDVRTLAQLISGPIFVAVHNYWYRFDDIASEANVAGADKIYQFDGITVYEFN